MDELAEAAMPGKRCLSPKLTHLRQKLYQKAKQEAGGLCPPRPGFRFYTLYEAVCREDVLLCAWLTVRENDGSFARTTAQNGRGGRAYIGDLRLAKRARSSSSSAITCGPTRPHASAIKL